MKSYWHVGALCVALLTGAGCTAPSLPSAPSAGTPVVPVQQVADVCTFYTQADLDSKLGKGFAGVKAPWGQFVACDYEHASRPETFNVRVYKTRGAKSAYDDFKREQNQIREGKVKEAPGVGSEAFWSYNVSEIAYMTLKNDKTVPGPKHSADFYTYKGEVLVWIEAHSDTIADGANFPAIATYFAQRALEKS